MLAIKPVYKKGHHAALIVASYRTELPFKLQACRGRPLHGYDTSGGQSTGFGGFAELGKITAADCPVQHDRSRKSSKSLTLATGSVVERIRRDEFQILAVAECHQGVAGTAMGVRTTIGWYDASLTKKPCFCGCQIGDGNNDMVE